MEKLRSDYEFRIATLQQRVSSLESQNAEFKEQANSAQSEASRVMETQAQLQEQNQAQADRVKNLEATLRNAEEVSLRAPVWHFSMMLPTPFYVTSTGK